MLHRVGDGSWLLFFFFFNDTATTEIYPLSLHDALPISRPASAQPESPEYLQPSAAPAPRPPWFPPGCEPCGEGIRFPSRGTPATPRPPPVSAPTERRKSSELQSLLSPLHRPASSQNSCCSSRDR